MVIQTVRGRRHLRRIGTSSSTPVGGVGPGPRFESRFPGWQQGLISVASIRWAAPSAQRISTGPPIDARPTTLAYTWSGSSENPMSPVQDGCRDNSGIDSGPDVSASAATGDEPVCGALVRGNEAMRARLLLIEDDKETADEIRAELGDHGLRLTGPQTASKGWIRR